MEESPPRIPELSELFWAELREVEVGTSVPRVRIREDPSARIVGYVYGNSICPYQRIVVIFRQGDGKSGREIRNPREIPAAHHLLGPAATYPAVKGQRPVVAEHKVVGHIEVAEADT